MNNETSTGSSLLPNKIAIVGLGYVGLPVALAFAKKVKTVGFDIDNDRIEQLRQGHDRTGETTTEELREVDLEVSADAKILTDADFIIIGVPTPIDINRQPNLNPLLSATRSVAENLSPGATIVYESTVYPGVTEEVCAPLICEVSGLDRSQFKLGYSPERINPGDKTHTLSTVVKVVSGEDQETLDRVAATYSQVATAGVFRAASIRVAEAAKVIENIQRDINIALMNELAIIFERIGINTRDVLDAAGTKWNFNRYSPGLVGGHCIGVDPYYLTAKAETLGYHPEIILAGRRLNDNMCVFVAQKMVKMLIAQGLAVSHCRVGVFGVTFKENVTDCRNSKAFSLIRELESFGVEVLAHDPLACPESVQQKNGVALHEIDELVDLDGIIITVPHSTYQEQEFQDIGWRYRGDGVLVDVRGGFKGELPSGIAHWCL